MKPDSCSQVEPGKVSSDLYSEVTVIIQFSISGTPLRAHLFFFILDRPVGFISMEDGFCPPFFLKVRLRVRGREKGNNICNHRRQFEASFREGRSGRGLSIVKGQG